MADKPASFSTVVTTDTTAHSLVVGGATPAATTGTGGVNSGPIVCTTVTGQLLAPAGIAIDGGTAATHGIKIPAATPSVVTSALYSPDGSALYYNGSPLATGSAVSGTAGQLAKFTAATTLGDSLLAEAGTTLTALASLKVQSGKSPGWLLGADVNGQTLTNATEKYGITATPHYTNAASPVLALMVDAATGANTVNIGGGLTAFNAATTVKVYTGATTTTDIGTLRATIDATGITSAAAVADSVGTMATIRAGGIGITSQAALDFIYASSSSQFARVASGGALTAPRINAAGTGWEMVASASAVVAYAVTKANVQNTTAQTTFLSFSVPSMADGDVIRVVMSGLRKQNKGTSGTMTIDGFYGASTATLSNALAQSDDATEFKYLAEYVLMRVGSDLWVFARTTTTPAAMVAGVFADGTSNAVVITAPTFGSAQTVALKMTLSAADATFYTKPQSAQALHFKA